jgi:hypothetical protein
MSGGSFNYLCHREADELLVRQQDIRDMVDFLNQMIYSARKTGKAPETWLLQAEKAKRETLELLLFIEQVEKRLNGYLDRLSPVWKAIEWWQSGDWSKDQFEEALKEYENK